MPYLESESKARLRKIRNSAVPVFNGITDKLEQFEVGKEDFHWLIERAEELERHLKEKGEPAPTPVLKTWKCTRCEEDEAEPFRAALQDNGFLPNCPTCGSDYRVFEIKE